MKFENIKRTKTPNIEAKRRHAKMMNSNTGFADSSEKTLELKQKNYAF